MTCQNRKQLAQAQGPPAQALSTPWAVYKLQGFLQTGVRTPEDSLCICVYILSLGSFAPGQAGGLLEPSGESPGTCTG